jgi:hypothetical protein
MFAENWIRRSIARIAVGVQPPASKLLYRRGGLSHALRHELSHELSHMTYDRPTSENPYQDLWATSTNLP